MRSITGKVLIGATVFLAYLAFMAVQAVNANRHMSAALSQMTDTVLPEATLNEHIELHLGRAVSDLRRGIYDRSPDALDTVAIQLAQTRKEIDVLAQINPGEHDLLFMALSEQRQILLDQIEALRADATTVVADHNRPVSTAQLAMLTQIEGDLEDLSSQRNDWLVQAANAHIQEVEALVHATDIAVPISYSALGLLTILMLWLLHRLIVQPVRILATVARAIGDGQLDQPIDTTGVDEIGQLQHAIRQMAADLRDHEQSLLERTAQVIEHQRLELELTRQRDVAEAANKAKSAFLAVMSHELRTPLTAIMGYSQLLERMVAAGDYSTTANDLRRISASGQHLLTLINEVLDLAQIEAGRFLLTIEHVDIPALVHSVTATVQPLVTQNHNTLRITCPEQMTTFATDPLRLRQVLLNLLGNAAKFTEAGEIQLNVTEERIDGTSWVAFAIADTGIGITTEQMEKLFKPFSQVNDSPSRRYGGTGLGLALSQRICRLLGGDISVESTFGVGSVFTIWLPVSIPAHHTESLATLPPSR